MGINGTKQRDEVHQLREAAIQLGVQFNLMGLFGMHSDMFFCFTP